jgi:predicted HTH domain antitoxin
MTIELPDQELGSLKLTSEQARVSLAVGLYAERTVTMGRAAKIAGIPYTAFMHELGKRGICVNYTVADLLQDIETVRQRLGK